MPEPVVDALVYRAQDATAREAGREAASRELAPDWYNRAPDVADVVSDVWEPHLREACALLRAHGTGAAVTGFLVRMAAVLDAAADEGPENVDPGDG